MNLSDTQQALLLKLSELDLGMTRHDVAAFLIAHGAQMRMGATLLGGSEQLTERTLSPLQRAGLVSAGQKYVRLTARGEEYADKLRAGADRPNEGAEASRLEPERPPLTDHGRSIDAAPNPLSDLARYLRSVWSDQQPKSTEEYGRTVDMQLRRGRKGENGPNDKQDG